MLLSHKKSPVGLAAPQDTTSIDKNILSFVDIPVNNFTEKNITISLLTKAMKKTCVLEYENDRLFKSFKNRNDQANILKGVRVTVPYLTENKSKEGLFIEYELRNGFNRTSQTTVLSDFDREVLNAAANVSKLCHSNTGEIYFRQKDILDILGGSVSHPNQKTLDTIDHSLNKLSQTWIWITIKHKGNLSQENREKAKKIAALAEKEHQRHNKVTVRPNYKFPLLDVAAVVVDGEQSFKVNGYEYKNQLYILHNQPFTFEAAKTCGHMINKPYDKRLSYTMQKQRKGSVIPGINQPARGTKQKLNNYLDGLIKVNKAKRGNKSFSVKMETIAKACEVLDRYQLTPIPEQKNKNYQFRFKFKKTVLEALNERRAKGQIKYQRKNDDTLFVITILQ